MLAQVVVDEVPAVVQVVVEAALAPTQAGVEAPFAPKRGRIRSWMRVRRAAGESDEGMRHRGRRPQAASPVTRPKPPRRPKADKGGEAAMAARARSKNSAAAEPR